MKVMDSNQKNIALKTVWRNSPAKKTGRPLGVKTSAGFAISDFTLVSPGVEFQFNYNKTFTKEIKKKKASKRLVWGPPKEPFHLGVCWTFAPLIREGVRLVLGMATQKTPTTWIMFQCCPKWTALSVPSQDLSQTRWCESQAAGFLLHAFGVLTHPFVAPAYVLHTGVSSLGYQQVASIRFYLCLVRYVRSPSSPLHDQPASPWSLRLLGACVSLEPASPWSLRLLGACVSLEPASPWSLRLLGACVSLEPASPWSLRLLGACVSLEPASPWSLRLLGACVSLEPASPWSLRLLGACVSLEPASPWSLRLLGACVSLEPASPWSLRLLGACVSLEPASPWSLRLLGACVSLEPASPWSLRLLGACVSLEPASPWSLRLLGACRSLGACVSLEPASPWSLRLLGACVSLEPASPWSLRLLGACEPADLYERAITARVGS